MKGIFVEFAKKKIDVPFSVCLFLSFHEKILERIICQPETSLNWLILVDSIHVFLSQAVLRKHGIVPFCA